MSASLRTLTKSIASMLLLGCLLPAQGCLHRSAPLPSDMTSAVLVMVRAMPSDSMCQSPCSTILVDPWVRAQRTGEAMLEPQRIESVAVRAGTIPHEGRSPLVAMAFSFDPHSAETIGTDTMGYRVVLPQGPVRDTLRLYLQFFWSRMQYGESQATLVRQEGHWKLVNLSTYVF